MSNIHGFDFLQAAHLDASGVDDDYDGEESPWHTNSLEAAGSGSPQTFEQLVLQARKKNTLEKLHDIINFLKKKRDKGKGPLSPEFIYTLTGIDIAADFELATSLSKNHKVRVEKLPDLENPAMTIPHYEYRSNFPNVQDRKSLLAQINRELNGISMGDLSDSYVTVNDDIRALITAGDIIGIPNSEDKDQILFPRGEAFLVELDGSLSVVDCKSEAPEPEQPEIKEETKEEETGVKKEIKEEEKGIEEDKDEAVDKEAAPAAVTSDVAVMAPHPVTSDAVVSSAVTSDTIVSDDVPSQPTPQEPSPPVQLFTIETDIDPTAQIRRGEAIWVGGQWFRVSSAVKEGIPLDKQPRGVQAPLSVTMNKDLHARITENFIRPLDTRTLPLDAPLDKTAQSNIEKAREARDHLVKLTHGRSGGVKDQLLGSHAHASNPTALAASLAGNVASGSMRKRPTAAKSSNVSKTPKINKDDLEKAASDPFLSTYRHARRHGCTKDIRELYLETRDLVPQDDADLHRVLLEHKLIEPGEQLRPKPLAKPSNLDEQGNKKKRRYYERKNQRWTNTHLDGSSIGRILALAVEKQKQGKTVGDGGM